MRLKLRFIQNIHLHYRQKKKKEELVRTLQNHTLFNALLEATILTSVALRLCYLTVAISDARIHTSVLYRAFEETLTSRNNQNRPQFKPSKTRVSIHIATHPCYCSFRFLFHVSTRIFLSA